MPHTPTDWVAAAKAAPVLNIGQLSQADIRALDSAVRRGELVKGRCPFFGRLREKAVSDVFTPRRARWSTA